MCSKTDSEETYCSEVEELLKVATSAIKCPAPKFCTLPLRRSQRILEKSKTKLVDLNDFCLCDLSCTDKVNKQKTKYANKNGVNKTKVSQDIFSTEDLWEDQQVFCDEYICKQSEVHPELKDDLKPLVNVPLDLSKKSKELIKETFKGGATVLLKGQRAQNGKENIKANSKLFATQNKNSDDCVIKNSKNKKLLRPKNVCTNRGRTQKNPKSYNNNVIKTDLYNCWPLLAASEVLKETSNKTDIVKEIVKSTDLDNINSSCTLKSDIKPLIVNTYCKPTIADDATTNSKPTKENLATECVITNEPKPSKSNTPSVLDISLKANAINILNKEEFIFKKCSTFQEGNKSTQTNEYQIPYKPTSNEIIKTNLKTSKKRIATSKDKGSAKKIIIDNLQTDSLVGKANTTAKKNRKSQLCKNSGSVSKNSINVQRNKKQAGRKQSKISTSKIKKIQKSIWSDKTLNIPAIDDRRKSFENLRTLDDSEKVSIEENYRKTLFRINSEDILTTSKGCGKFRRKRRLSLSQNAVIPIKQLKRSMSSTETLKNLASFQNPLTPAQSTQDVLPKSILPDVYPPHFKYQLPPEAALFNRRFTVQPTYVITPDDTPSIELLDSSSSSPSLPESLCELLQTKDIKELLNVDKVAYRLYDYHIEALALVLNLSQDYLLKILDKIVNIRPNVLKNINKAVKEPFVTDQDLFTAIPNQTLVSEEIVFNSQSP